MMLVAAKYREFVKVVAAAEAADAPVEDEPAPAAAAGSSAKSSRRAAAAAKEFKEPDSDSDSNAGPSKRGSARRSGRSGGKGTKSSGKVPTLKIKIGGRKKKGSSVSGHVCVPSCRVTCVQSDSCK
jgi:chromodomain-helicase-DNA-binding protein 4